MKRFSKVCLAVVALTAVLAHPVSAGRTDTSPVSFFYFGTEGSAAGSLGSTRGDGDPTSYVRCESHWTLPDDYQGSCAAEATGGLFVDSCTFPPFAQVEYQYTLATMTPDSFVSFSWDTSTQVCDSLYVYSDSFDEPKLP